MLCCSPASAVDFVVTLEYYQTSESAIIDKIKIMEKMNDEKRQILYDDRTYADESSGRTLNALLDIFQWYQITQYRDTMTQDTLLFSQDFIVSENEATYHGIEVPEGRLDVSFDVRSGKNRKVRIGFRVIFNNVELYSGTPSEYPIDKFMLLHESYLEIDDEKELEMLFIKVTHCPPDLCPKETERNSEFDTYNAYDEHEKILDE